MAKIIRLTESDLNRIVRRVVQEQFNEPMKKMYKRLHFNNGGSVSVQASDTHYCEPRDNKGPYSKVEVGYPTKGTKLPQILMSFQETPDEMVFPYVPANVVEVMVEMNGGIKSGELPPLTTDNESDI